MSDPVRTPLPISKERATAVADERSDMEALLLRVPEAAARLGVSRAKLYELIASGALPAVKIDGCRRVRTDDLRASVEGLAPSQ